MLTGKNVQPIHIDDTLSCAVVGPLTSEQVTILQDTFNEYIAVRVFVNAFGIPPVEARQRKRNGSIEYLDHTAHPRDQELMPVVKGDIVKLYWEKE
jgi:hypothetical protein